MAAVWRCRGSRPRMGDAADVTAYIVGAAACPGSSAARADPSYPGGTRSPLAEDGSGLTATSMPVGTTGPTTTWTAGDGSGLTATSISPLEAPSLPRQPPPALSCSAQSR